MTFKVQVSDHAREQARARFPGFKAARIVDEVRAALAEGRVSTEPPNGLAPSRHEQRRTLYAWTPDGHRCYALRPTDAFFWVTTAMRPLDVAA